MCVKRGAINVGCYCLFFWRKMTTITHWLYELLGRYRYIYLCRTPSTMFDANFFFVACLLGASQRYSCKYKRIALQHTCKRTVTQACSQIHAHEYMSICVFFPSSEVQKNRVFSCALSAAAVCLSVCLFGWFLRLLWCLCTYHCMRFAAEEENKEIHPSLSTHHEHIRRWRGHTISRAVAAEAAPPLPIERARLPIQRKSKNQTSIWFFISLNGTSANNVCVCSLLARVRSYSYVYI